MVQYTVYCISQRMKYLLVGETVPSDVTIQSTTSTVLQGETLELNCVVQGNPPPSVIWSRANGIGLSSNHQVSLTADFSFSFQVYSV